MNAKARNRGAWVSLRDPALSSLTGALPEGYFITGWPLTLICLTSASAFVITGWPRLA